MRPSIFHEMHRIVNSFNEQIAKKRKEEILLSCTLSVLEVNKLGVVINHSITVTTE